MSKRQSSTGPNFRHGLCKTLEYGIWSTMKSRCHNENANRYRDYGGRGIRVCQRWHTFMNFYKDMGPRPSQKHSLERLDNNKDYAPENCRWATSKEQLNNKRNSRLLTFNGETLNYSQWARKLNFGLDVIPGRIMRGWTTEAILTTPSRVYKKKN